MAEQPRFAGIEFPLRPMIAVAAGQLPLDRPGGWAFEPKFDGFVRHEVHVIEGGGRPLRRIVAAMW